MSRRGDHSRRASATLRIVSYRAVGAGATLIARLGLVLFSSGAREQP